ncbi:MULTISPECIES: hypothetical protein [Streptomyces]|uniref:SMODS and SLOG-associating 2TM effector domain-containing protein n=1 Tax=Streptomyces canarius TaxID=285453 RepID=A0ABQ3D8C9_9ACTN|nr:hypothetical protein [Streptomyces canarius]GHA54785.1 hypothetical protein GCM10010345_69290 [Streptomyces canarius]
MNMNKQAARGLVDIEAYLYREAHLTAARRRVTAFTARMDGLTHEQKRDIELWYLEEQKYVARMVTKYIADSVGAAETANNIRFGRWLRGTVIAMAVITVLTFVCTAVVVGSVS